MLGLQANHLSEELTMSSIIKADSGAVSGITGITSTGDNSGTLEFQATSGIIEMDNVTGALALPVGTTAQRPGTPIVGMQRWNSTLGVMEVFVGNSIWQSIASTSYSVEYLLVAGGGGGSLNIAGGGAGGALASTTSLTPTTIYSIVIGAGCPADTNANGSNTTGFGFTAIGGGSGSGSSGGIYVARSGGSGGGGQDTPGYNPGGAGTVGQGNAGGNNPPSGASGGGGGGAGAAGSSGTGANIGGAGGVGINWQSLGTYYAGGGGGAGSSGISPGGSGGGGSGGKSGTSSSVAGSVNTGGGGGGGYATPGAPGGSGIAIIRYAGAQRGSGGTVTSAGGYTYHTFTTSGTYTA